MPGTDIIATVDIALQIARVILTPIYGLETIRQEEPLTAELHGDEWEVAGTLHCPQGAGTCNGGVVEISIKKKDGRIVRISHGR